MFIIGERINGMFQDVAAAIKEQNKDVIYHLAKKQIECGASALDVNVGPSSADPLAAMKWLVETIQEVTTDVPLAIDTTKFEVMELGVSLCKLPPIINSTSGDEAKLNQLLSLASKYNASIIGLTMNKSGIPQSAEARMEIAMQIVASAMEHGIEPSQLFIDAVILPVNVAQPHAKEVLETIKQTKVLADPSPKTVIGLSNVSQGAKDRELVNRTYAVMAVSYGLDAAILDPMDTKLVDAIITAELLMDKQLYCESYLTAYRK